ncbi:Zinc finger CW-type PWWP domain protein 1 [Schistosoma japonicum]|nr:Zinc finger CW-type PWWP domain protein 1 [Schistosoma japonicum]
MNSKSKMSDFDKFLNEVLDHISTIPSDILYTNYFKYSKRKRNQSSINDVSGNKRKYNRIGSLKISEALLINEPDSTHYLCININEDYDLTGTWIECNFCSKWRYLPYVYDASSLSDPWYCALNPKYYGNLTSNSTSNKYMHNPCKEPEDLSAGKDQFIFGHFSVGSVVWARIQGYPDWPTMVFYNSQGKYAEFNPISKEVTYYYVVTLDPKRSKMSRVKVDNIHKFTSFDEINLSKVPKRYWRRLQAAGYEAENALLLSTKDRIATYGYNHKYEDISFKVAAQIKSSISSNQRILKNVSYNLKRKRAYKRRVPLIHSSSINVDPKGQTDNLNTDFDHTSGIVECNAEKCSSSFLKAITNSTKLMSINNHEHHEYGEDSNRYSSKKANLTRNVNDNDKHENLMTNNENYFKLACFDLSFYLNMHNLNVNDIQMSTNHSYRHTYQHWSLNCNKRILYENVPFHYQYFGDNEV